MNKIFVFLKIVQVVSNEERTKNGLKKLGKGYFKAYRLNPWNPLSYVCAIIMLIFIFLGHGFIGFFEKAYNPFLWD